VIDIPFGTVDDVDEMVHWGHIRVADGFVIVHDGEEKSECCGDGRVVLVPLREVKRLTRFPNAEALATASKTFTTVGDLRYGTPEVR